MIHEWWRIIISFHYMFPLPMTDPWCCYNLLNYGNMDPIYIPPWILWVIWQQVLPEVMEALKEAGATKVPWLDIFRLGHGFKFAHCKRLPEATMVVRRGYFVHCCAFGYVGGYLLWISAGATICPFFWNTWKCLRSGWPTHLTVVELFQCVLVGGLLCWL